LTVGVLDYPALHASCQARECWGTHILQDVNEFSTLKKAFWASSQATDCLVVY
jgi:hypothetical protein